MSVSERVFVVVDGREIEVEVMRGAQGTSLRFDGRLIEVDERWSNVGDGQGVAVGSLAFSGRLHEVAVLSLPRAGGGSAYSVTVRGEQAEVEVYDPLTFLSRKADAASGRKGTARILAPMPGRVVSVLLSEGDAVQVGDGVVVVEAMKMENEIRSELAGEVAKIFVEQGATVESGDPLFEIRAT
jgi:biotin carboxyl carrier protein